MTARSLLLVSGFAILAGFGSAPAAAQEREVAATSSSSVSRPLATRKELNTRLETLKDSLSSASEQAAPSIRQQMETIRRRLEQGDFRVGDLVEMTVRQDASLTGTFGVNGERKLELPKLPPVSLDGVLYSEVEEALTKALGEYLRDPNVRARALWRVAVVGGVTKPGFYDLSPSTTLSEVLMRAGGPTQQAKLDEVEFRRNERNLLEHREEPIETITLAELNAQRGDQVFVPQSGTGPGLVRILGVVSGVAGTAWAIANIF